MDHHLNPVQGVQQQDGVVVHGSDNHLSACVQVCVCACTAWAAGKTGPMEPCALGKDKLKRPKIWTNWHREAKNKMRLRGIATISALSEIR